MTELGQNDQFPPANLSDGCGVSKQTLAGVRGNDEVARRKRSPVKPRCITRSARVNASVRLLSSTVANKSG
jgi:hypothetical protein